MGLPGSDSIVDKSIPTFARGELPHFAGINTFLKAPYVENVRDVGKYDAAVIGIPFDSGTTYRPGTRFGPQGIRRISALYTPYNYELGVDLREQMTLCDAGDVFTIPANLEKSFDQISRGVSHVFSSGALPVMLGGDHSIGFPCVRGIAQCTSKKIGIVHFGIGAFHRAHQAAVFDNLIRRGDPRWGICGASLRSPSCRPDPSTS